MQQLSYFELVGFGPSGWGELLLRATLMTLAVASCPCQRAVIVAMPGLPGRDVKYQPEFPGVPGRTVVSLTLHTTREPGTERCLPPLSTSSG